MPELAHAAFSYRGDPAVPGFDDGQALFVFDGDCVLCSGGAALLMRHDRGGLLRFTATASALGGALCRHYGIDPDETYLLVVDGRAYTASAGYLRLCGVLGGAWRLLRIGVLIPERWRDGIYALVARHRYRWFGKTATCALLTSEQRARLL